MSRPPPTTILLCAIALCATGLVAATVAARLPFPWPLEWMEGASLQHAQRLRQGLDLYPPPSADFIPFLYPPLSYVPMALSTALFGDSLPAARLPSLLSLLLSTWLLYRWAFRLAGLRAGLLAGSLWLLGYGYCGAFMDLARVDAFFVLLAIAGGERLAARHTRVALLLLVASCFAKQHGALFLVAACLWLLWHRRGAGWAEVGWSLAAALAGWGVAHFATDGRFGFYVLQLPRSHPIEAPLLLSFIWFDTFAHLPLLALLALRVGWLARGQQPLHLVLLLAGLFAGALGRAHAGGFDNVRLPAFALLSLVGAVGWVQWMHASGRRGRLLLWAALSLQILMLVQLPSAHAPPPQSGPAFAALRAELQRCGASWAPSARVVALDYGPPLGSPFVHSMALSDLRMAGRSAVGAAASASLLQRLSGPRAPEVVALGERFAALESVLAANYEVCDRRPAPPTATGYRPREQLILRRRATQLDAH